MARRRFRMSETPDTPSTGGRYGSGRATSRYKTPDTPSTEDLTPERLAEALERWYPNSPNPSSAVAAAIIAGLDAERAVRQEAADPSGLREAERLLEDAVAFLANNGGYQWKETLSLIQQARAALRGAEEGGTESAPPSPSSASD
jgi:hypothetical protein